MSGSDLRLVIFDVDGTLVDSQNEILSAMRMAFEGIGLPARPGPSVLSIVGLSLDVAVARLAPEQDTQTQAEIVQGYKNAFAQLRQHSVAGAAQPFYPGMRAVLDHLSAQPHTLLGVATGKSQRGLNKLIEAHGLEGLFVTRQVADHHPSKPHPSMLMAAMAETGVGPERSVMIGDTSFDMEMAQAAGIPAIGVSWGYHDRKALCLAHSVANTGAELPGLIDTLTEITK